MATLDTHVPDNRWAGDFPVVTDVFTILTNQDLAAMTLMGKVTASGKLLALDGDASDGSEDPFAIMIDALDTTGADKSGAVYLTGEFNQDAIILVDGSDEIATYKDALRALSIFVKPIQEVV